MPVRFLDREAVDLIILDLMMPGEDGLTLINSLRKTTDVSIIMLTAKGEPADHIVALELGADDYISKPCDLRQLLARVRSVLRRTRGDRGVHSRAEKPSLLFEGWRLDLSRRQLRSPDDAEVVLTTGEFDLLEALATNAKQVLSRDQLLNLTKGRDGSPFDRSIDNLISRLRQKLEADPKHPSLLKTVQGVGYVFTAHVNRQ